MGKKHKKHHKLEKKIQEYEEKPEKPLKLVLKVAAPETFDPYADKLLEERRHKHKKKKKKKSSDKEKHRHEEKSPKKRDREEYENELCMPSSVKAESPAKKYAPAMAIEADMDEDDTDKKLREPRTCTVRQDGEPSLLRMCLEYIQRILQRKDVHGFFAFPVNDVIAPGYSSIIHHPMDFSTMLAKIEDDEYQSVSEYKKDIILMCNNAMTYNRPETIYYKEAKKLLHSALKLMSKDKLLNMKRSLSFMSNITTEELGIDDFDDGKSTLEAVQEQQQQLREKKAKAKNVCRFEAIPDNMTPEEILAQAQAAAKSAADLLTLRQPNTKFGFLRRRKDGSTSLTILNPDNEGKVSETERIVTLGTMATKLQSGSGLLSGFKEDKRNKVTPVNYLTYGPFSSYAPSHDSTFANISKEASDLLLSTYGDETGVQYAKSVMSFVEGAGDYAIKMVDNLLDALTNGEHTKAQRQLENKRKEEQRKQTEDNASKREQTRIVEGSGDNYGNVDFGSLRSLLDLGVDISFLDHYEKEISKEKEVQQKLDQTAGLIQDLHHTQHTRLSQRPPTHLAYITPPCDKESQLANKVTQELKELAKQATPSGVVSFKSLRAAMGITMHPLEGEIGVTPTEPVVVDDEDARSQTLTHLSHDEAAAADIDRELQEFLEQGPTLKVCDSPTKEREMDIKDDHTSAF